MDNTTQMFNFIDTVLTVNKDASQRRTVLTAFTSFIDNMTKSTTIISSFTTVKTVIVTKSVTVKFAKRSKHSLRVLQDDTDEKVDYTACENQIRGSYNIPDDKSLIVREIEINKDLFPDEFKGKSYLAGNSIRVDFIDPDTNAIYSKEHCNAANNAMITYTLDNLGFTIKGITFGYNPFNKNDLVFKSRCVSIPDPLYGADTTLGYRIRSYWSGLEPQTNSSCLFIGLSDGRQDVQLICDVNTSNDGVIYWFNELALPNPSTSNLDIASCPHMVQTATVRFNAGFWIGLLITIAFVTSIVLGCFTKNKSNYNMSKVYHGDYSTNNGGRGKVYEMERVRKTDVEKNDLVGVDGVVLEDRHLPQHTSAPFDKGGAQVYLRDIDQMPYREALSSGTDSRSWFQFLTDYYVERTFLSLAFKQSILVPFWIRLNYCLLFISMLWFINAMLIMDSYIDARILLPKEVKVSHTP
jgi:hypothetical protein